jgi:hypothetical protein
MKLELLQDFMLTGKKLAQTIIINKNESFKNNAEITSKMEKKVQVLPNESSKEENKHFLYPKQKDALFWCFYIMKNGQESYEMLENINIITEKKIKIEYVELLRKNKQLIKSAKIAPLVNIENYLVNESKIDIKTFLALCIVEKIELLYIHKNTFFLLSEKDIDDLGELHVLKQRDNPANFGVFLNESEEKIKDYITNFYRVENMAKPLKAPSGYKVSEIVDIAKKLGIEIINKETNKQKTKNEIYELVVQYF